MPFKLGPLELLLILAMFAVPVVLALIIALIIGLTSRKSDVGSAGVSAGNTSGGGKVAGIPDGIRGWNWGAFFFTWIWGVCNNVWIALLALVPVPFIGIVMAIILGVQGNEWAWQNKSWDSVEHFKKVQRNWAYAGVILALIVLAFWLIALSFFLPVGCFMTRN